MDLRLSKRWHLRRQPGETLHRFAGRIRDTVASFELEPNHRKMAVKTASQGHEIARWYETYASVRYNASIDDGTIAALKAALSGEPPPA
jgi:hypothetical protein